MQNQLAELADICTSLLVYCCVVVQYFLMQSAKIIRSGEGRLSEATATTI